MSHPLHGVDSSISIGKIERRYESLQTYDRNIFYIWQNLINTNNIYSTNITRNLPRDFILNRFETLKYFWQALKYFYIMCDIAWYDNWHAVKWYSNSRPSELFASYFQWEVECKKPTSCVFQFWRRPKLFCDSSVQITWFKKIYDEYVNGPIKGDFQKTLLLFHIGRKSFVEYKWLWLHTTTKSLLGLYFMIDNQTV